MVYRTALVTRPMVTRDGYSSFVNQRYPYTPCHLCRLVARPAALRAGQTYRFEIVATSAAGATVSDKVTVVANTPPTAGQFTVHPQAGVELTTSFAFDSTGWSDLDGDAASLTHAFSYTTSSASARVVLCERASGANASAVALLPAGNLTLLVTVVDVLGGASTLAVEGVTVATSANVVHAIQNMTSDVSALIEAGSGEAALSLIAVGAESLATAAAAESSGDDDGGGGDYDDDDDDNVALVELRTTLLSLAWNASRHTAATESESTIALRAATLELILLVPSQARHRSCSLITRLVCALVTPPIWSLRVFLSWPLSLWSISLGLFLLVSPSWPLSLGLSLSLSLSLSHTQHAYQV